MGEARRPEPTVQPAAPWLGCWAQDGRLPDLGDGSPSGKPDGALLLSENISDVFANAEKILAEQIGRAA